MHTPIEWLEVFPTAVAMSSVVMEVLRETFARFGILETRFWQCSVSEDFELFLQRNGVKHITSAPYHPASNRLAVWIVQILKQGLTEGTLNTQLAHIILLAYCNTPQSTTAWCISGWAADGSVASDETWFPEIKLSRESEQQTVEPYKISRWSSSDQDVLNWTSCRTSVQVRKVVGFHRPSDRDGRRKGDQVTCGSPATSGCQLWLCSTPSAWEDKWWRPSWSGDTNWGCGGPAGHIIFLLRNIRDE